ncbi:MAG: GDP-mannose 4,6-dehydratase [Anaerolineae bacterium]
MRALVTGVAGFAGGHLAERLLRDGDVEVHGIANPHHASGSQAHLAGAVLHQADLTQPEEARAVVEAVRPDWLFHLAAQASVGESWRAPERTLVDNLLMQLHVLQAVESLGLGCRVLVVGTADEYGRVQPEDLPISEDVPLRPVNPYAVSKIAQDYLGLQYHLGCGLDVVRVRPFNHIGPRQGTGFVVPDWCSQLARIEAGLVPPVLRVGNLSARRDFSDVRDVARAYRLALERGRAGAVYNIGSGQAVAMREVLDTLLGLVHATVQVEPDPARMRPSDTPVLACDAGRFVAETGWQPRYSLKESLRDVLDDWRTRVRSEAGTT